MCVSEPPAILIIELKPLLFVWTVSCSLSSPCRPPAPPSGGSRRLSCHQLSRALHYQHAPLNQRALTACFRPQHFYFRRSCLGPCAIGMILALHMTDSESLQRGDEEPGSGYTLSRVRAETSGKHKQREGRKGKKNNRMHIGEK